jgi:hypothetical protein
MKRFSIAWQESQLRVKSPMYTACKKAESHSIKCKSQRQMTIENNVKKLLKAVMQAETEKKRQMAYDRLKTKFQGQR